MYSIMAVNALIESYRKVYVTIKTYPFLYTLLLLILSPLEAWLSLSWAEALGLLTFTSVPSVWMCVKLSYPLKLCNWYRAQCFVTLLPLSIPLCRIFCPTLNIAWVWGGVAFILVASLVNCYKTFIRPMRKD